VIQEVQCERYRFSICVCLDVEEFSSWMCPTGMCMFEQNLSRDLIPCCSTHVMNLGLVVQSIHSKLRLPHQHQHAYSI
jgi:hypothetical protein